MENQMLKSIGRLLDGHVERRVSTTYDPYRPEEVPETQKNKDGS